VLAGSHLHSITFLKSFTKTNLSIFGCVNNNSTISGRLFSTAIFSGDFSGRLSFTVTGTGAIENFLKIANFAHEGDDDTAVDAVDDGGVDKFDCSM
jgi:hypothetical protein